MSAPGTIGVVGAGTMGAGIAQLACAAGIETLLHDPVPEALERGIAGVGEGLAKQAARGRLDGSAEQARAQLSPAAAIADLARCELVIEAAPEQLELKRELFAALSEACAPATVLATNTSSIPVTALASAASRPEQVVGMHFFNPPPLMRLLEVIPGAETSADTLAVARATGEALGKRVIVAADEPGFLVNRCGRPFYTEALRAVAERVATHEQVDRICRLGGGFRMGPFELMDLVGIDVGLAVARSFSELSFGEPRWRPSPLQAQMVAAGRLGRKTGRGWYAYGEGPHRPDDGEAPVRGSEAPTLAVTGDDPGSEELRRRSAVERSGSSETEMVSCAAATLASQGRPGAVGFVLTAPVAEGGLVELIRGPGTPDSACADAERAAAVLGLRHEWVGDSPGGVLGRIVASLVNEAAFAIGEGVGSGEDVDTGLELGLNHPRGPVAWGDTLGLASVLATVDGLWAERHEERYRAAPLLRRAADLGVSLVAANG